MTARLAAARDRSVRRPDDSHSTDERYLLAGFFCLAVENSLFKPVTPELTRAQVMDKLL